MSSLEISRGRNILDRFPSYDRLAPIVDRYLWLAGVSLDIIGGDNVTDKSGKLITPNHWSPPRHLYADHIILGMAHSRAQGIGPQSDKKQLRFVARDTFFEHQWATKRLRNLGAVPVGDSIVQIKDIVQLVGEGYDAVLYPEGGVRRNDGKRVKKIERGAGMIAKWANVPLIPTAIIYGHQHGFRKQDVIVKFGAPIDSDHATTSRESDRLLCEAMNHVITGGYEDFGEKYGYTPLEPIPRVKTL